MKVEKVTCALAGAALALLLAGCIVQDQSSTLIINPDGSSELVIVRTNIRSTLDGERAASETAEYRRAFDRREQDEFARVRKAGASLEQALWLRRAPPMANVIRVLFPSAAALEKFAEVKTTDGGPDISLEFSQTGTLRRMILGVALPAEGPRPPVQADDVERYKLRRAAAVSEIRIALSDGEIVAARGFVTAPDRQSALLDIDEVNSRLHVGDGKAELLLEWEVSEE
jgi:hypothetical protein